MLRTVLAVIRVFLWHYAGWGLIGLGVFLVLGDLLDVGFGRWPFGLVLVAFGTWVWVRAIHSRRALSDAKHR